MSVTSNKFQIDNNLLWPPLSKSSVVDVNDIHNTVQFNSIDITIHDKALFEFIKSTNALVSIHALGLKSDLIHSNSKYGFIHLSIDKNICIESNSYNLHIVNQQVSIIGADHLGVLYGLHTFTQFMNYYGMFKTDQDNNFYIIIPKIRIYDQPDVIYRSVMWSYKQEMKASLACKHSHIKLLLYMRINTIYLVIDSDITDIIDESVENNVLAYLELCKEFAIRVIPTIVLSSIHQKISPDALKLYDRSAIALIITIDANSIITTTTTTTTTTTSEQEEDDRIIPPSLSSSAASSEQILSLLQGNNMNLNCKDIYKKSCEDMLKHIHSLGYTYITIASSAWAQSASNPMILASASGLIPIERDLHVMYSVGLKKKPILATNSYIQALKDTSFNSTVMVYPSFNERETALFPAIISNYYLALFSGCLWSKAALPLLLNIFNETYSSKSKLLKSILNFLILSQSPLNVQIASSYKHAISNLLTGETVRSVLSSQSSVQSSNENSNSKLAMVSIDDLCYSEQDIWSLYTNAPQLQSLTASDTITTNTLPIMIPTKLQAAICLKICNKIIHTAQWKLTSSSSEDIWEHFFGTLHIYGVICKTILLSGSDPDNKSIALSNRHTVVNTTATSMHDRTTMLINTNTNNTDLSQQQTVKRPAVFDQLDLNCQPVYFPKDAKIANMISKVVENNLLFQSYKIIASLIVDGFERMGAVAGEVIIKQHDSGDFFYILETGKADIRIESDGFDIKVGTISGGESFGELALLYNTPRAATVICVEDTVLWRISRQNYRVIVAQSTTKTASHYVSLISNVEILGKRLGDVLNSNDLHKVVSSLEVETFTDKQVIVRQYSTGDNFYIIVQGIVEVWQEQSNDEKKRASIQEGFDADGNVLQKELYGTKLSTLSEGDYFGEKALLADDERQASCVAEGNVTCLCLCREDFNNMLGSYQDLFHLDQQSTDDMVEDVMDTDNELELTNITLDDLTTICLLGTGAFGRVCLVKHKQSNQRFALKCQDKDAIVKQGMQKMVVNELHIMRKIRHPCITQLYGFFQDKKYIFFVLELLSGGEFFNYLQSVGKLSEDSARFYSASVVCAFEELHKNKIAYRDLKPENMVLDSKGYVKIVDLGLAKQIPTGNTWTMAGTPDYLAPELVLNKGHNHAVDYWALGVLIYEMVHGWPPFYHEDPMKIYAKIISGRISYPIDFSEQLEDIISKLCTKLPSKRLGNMKGNILDLKKHKWFGPFNWKGLLRNQIATPFVPNDKIETPSYLKNYVTQIPLDSDWVLE